MKSKAKPKQCLNSTSVRFQTYVVLKKNKNKKKNYPSAISLLTAPSSGGFMVSWRGITRV